MNTVKRIAWKSWHAIEEVLCYEPQLDMGNIDDIDDEDDMEAMSPEMPFPFFPIIETTPKLLHTPLGLYPADSMFKPSDRWDCWIGLTNFSITNSIKENNGINELSRRT